MVLIPSNTLFQLLPERSGTAAGARAQYERDGVLLVPSVFDTTEVTAIRDTFTKQVESDNQFARCDNGLEESDILNRYPRSVHPHRHPETLAGSLARRLLVDERLLNVVTNLIGPAYGAQTMFYFKPPTARGQAMHQDNWFLKAHPETCLAAWVAIDDADVTNGGLLIHPGSHKQPILCHGEANVEESFINTAVPVPKGMKPVETTLKAGDVLFFHGSLVHGSMPNTSDRFRRALINHYIPQASKEISTWYIPLIAPDGEEVADMPTTDQGGACGEVWVK